MRISALITCNSPICSAPIAVVTAWIVRSGGDGEVSGPASPAVAAGRPFDGQDRPARRLKRTGPKIGLCCPFYLSSQWII